MTQDLTLHGLPSKEGPRHRTRRLLFVCDGNICRSAVALLFFRRHQAAGQLQDWHSDSAGLVAAPGDVPLRETRVAARNLGVPVDDHLARPLAASDGQAALALIMEERQRRPLMAATGLDAEQVLMLGRFAPAPDGAAIADPFGGTPLVYDACLQRIGNGVASLVRWLATPASMSGKTTL